MRNRSIQTIESSASRRINALEARLKHDRLGKYQRANTAVDAIYGQLSGTIRGQGRKLSAANRTILARMAAVRQRAAEGGRVVAGAESQSRALYGGILGDVARQDFGTARATAKGGSAVAGAQLAAGQQSAQTGRDLVTMAQASASEAHSGQLAANSQALAAQTKQDVAQVAAMRQQLEMQKLQFAMQEQAAREAFQRQKKMFEFQQSVLAKNAQKVGGPSARQDVLTLTSSLPEFARDIKNVIDRGYDVPQTDASGNPVLDSNGQPVVQHFDGNSPSDILRGLQATGVFTPDPNDPQGAAIVKGLIQQVLEKQAYGDLGGRQAGVDAVMATIRTWYPDYYRAHQKNLEATVKAALNAQYAASAYQNPAGATGDPTAAGGGLNDTLNTLETMGAIGGGFPGLLIGAGRYAAEHAPDAAAAIAGGATDVTNPDWLAQILNQQQ